MENLYIYAIISLILLFLIFILVRKILNINPFKYKKTKSLQNTINEIKKKLEDSPDDYESIYELAKIEESIGEEDSAFQKYEQLIESKVLDKSDEILVLYKLESRYESQENWDNAFRYSIKILKTNPNDVDHIIKFACILAEHEKYQLACDYFNKALYAKNNFSNDALKRAIYSFMKVGNTKKSITMLEELHKRLKKEYSENKEEISNLEISLISLYMMADEYNIAKGFIENSLLNKSIDDTHKFNINRLYLFMLYKLEENENFRKLYDYLSRFYKVDEPKISIANLVLDFAFYSYYLNNIMVSSRYFNFIASIIDKNKENNEFAIFDINAILKYLNSLSMAVYELNKLQKTSEVYKSDNFVNYVPKGEIELWEKSVKVWETSFVNILYIVDIFTPKNNIKNFDSIILELSFNSADNDSKDSSNNSTKKVDSIYNLNKLEFKRICNNLVKNKLLYSIVQEYESDNDDEVNYITYHMKGSKKDLTLISFKRWKKVEIGELMVRDFLITVKEAGAKNGILIAPIDLSRSAKSYVAHHEEVKVYGRNQFENLLKDEKI